MPGGMGVAASTFDSREAYHRLREGGMDEPVANAVVEILSPFVTRDILRAELATVRAEVKADLASMQLRIISFNVAIATIAVAVVTQVT